MEFVYDNLHMKIMKKQILVISTSRELVCMPVFKTNNTLFNRIIYPPISSQFSECKYAVKKTLLKVLWPVMSCIVCMQLDQFLPLVKGPPGIVISCVL